MQLKDTILADKSFSKEFDSQTLAQETKALIKRMRYHILQDNCTHCKHILAGDKDD